MTLIGTYYTIEPKDWLFSTHGDVVEAKGELNCGMRLIILMKGRNRI